MRSECVTATSVELLNFSRDGRESRNRYGPLVRCARYRQGRRGWGVEASRVDVVGGWVGLRLNPHPPKKQEGAAPNCRSSIAGDGCLSVGDHDEQADSGMHRVD